MELPKRKPTRLKGYDYDTPGAYFITVCVHNRRCILSRIVGAIHESPLRRYRTILSKMVGYLKMNASKKIHETYPEKKIWQRDFHDHIIRSERDYQKIAEYISTNVIRWEKDCFYEEADM